MAQVTVTAWSWRYSSRADAVCPPVSFTVNSGEKVLLLGASGSGKSTLLSAIAGVLGDDEGFATGSIVIEARDVVPGSRSPGSRAPGNHAQGSRAPIGLVLQDPQSQIIMERVGDDVAFGLENLAVDREHIWPRVHDALAVVGLGPESGVTLETSTTRLSGGQQQRLALAGVLAMQPQLLLLDEPTANIDPASIPALTNAVEAVVARTGATVIMVEHRVQYWWHFADRLIVLGSQGLLFDGAPSTLTKPVISQLQAAGVWLPEALEKSHPRTLSQKSRSTPEKSRSTPGKSGLTSHVSLETDALQSGYPARGYASTDTTPRHTSPLTIELATGEIHVLTGPNGSGKTASALTISGVLKPLSGGVLASAQLADNRARNPCRWKPQDLLSRIGFVFQAPEHQFLANSVRQELAIGLRVLKLSDTEIERRVDALLESMQLADVADAHPLTLSGGQKRRLSVATSLITEPQVLILDEPTLGQDSVTWQALVNLLREYTNRGNTVLAITHDEKFIAQVADRETVLA